MAAETIWTEETQVRASETDFRKQWKISAFFSAMQEAAGNHASHLGYDYREMLKNEIVWVVSRIKICFHAFPLSGEPVTLKTWPKGLQQRLFFMRDFQVTGSDGRPLASASLAFLLVNTRARRILQPQALGGEIPDNGGLSAIEEPLEKIPPAESLETVFTTRAGYSAVDLMEHVNNARYADWVSDCFSFEEHQSGRLRWLQINYNNEIKPGETVELARARRDVTPNRWYVTGINQTTGAKSFDAELEWDR